MFIVDPNGRRVLDKNSPLAAIRVRDKLEDIPLVGESVRSLSTTFNGDDLEHGKFRRFFGPA